MPLSGAALCVLKAIVLLSVACRRLDVPGGGTGRPLSDMGMMMLLRRMKRDDLTVHGFRSTFRDWVKRRTTPERWPNKRLRMRSATIERLIAAVISLERRRLMEDWAGFCARPEMPAAVAPDGSGVRSGPGICDSGAW